jgi:glycosyltransferase involved in cell wall biosynthesis
MSGPPHDPYILCVGRLDDRRKNIGLLLEAYLQLPGEVLDQVHLVLAGSAPPPAAFWQRANSSGAQKRIRFIARPDSDTLLELYRHASVFALPSDEEGFGMVVIEAMACGIPVVATKCGGPDGIISGGQDGYLVPRNDAAAMSNRLADLLQNAERNAAMGAAARQTIEQRYDERVAGDVFLDMWDRLLHKSGAGRCVG